MVKELSEQEIKTLAINTFNKTWEYIEKKNRTKVEDEMMIHCAHTSRYFWGLVGSPMNFERGDWIISRVYSILNKGSEALYYGKSCIETTLENNYGGFDLAFAYEAVARSYAMLGNNIEFEKYFLLAKEAGEKIEKQEDREYFFNDLRSGNWNGMKI